MKELDKKAKLKALSKFMDKGFNMKEGPSIYFVRHGSTGFNSDVNKDKDRIRGWIDVPLNTKGEADAERAGKELEGKDIAKIYSSDLIRAKQTASIIAKHVGNPPIITSKSLRPWDLGEYQGKLTKEVLPHINAHIDNEHTAVKDGESFSDFINRFLSLLKQIMHEAQTNNQNIVVVTHFRNTKVLHGWDKHNHVDKKIMKEDGIKTGEIIRWTFDGKDWKDA